MTRKYPVRKLQLASPDGGKAAASESRPAHLKSAAPTVLAEEPSRLTAPVPSPAEGSESERCCQLTAHGRRCSMPLSPVHPSLCPYHARCERQLLDIENVSTELTSSFGELRTANDIQCALAKVFSLLSQDRIPRRKAVALAYVGQLLLQSLPTAKSEIHRAFGHDTVDRFFREQLEPLFPR